MKRWPFILASLLWTGGATLADTVYTRDGHTRVGIIESRDDHELRLRMDSNGISSVLVLPMSQVTYIVMGGAGGTAGAATHPQSAPALTSTTNPAASTLSLNSSPSAAKPATSSTAPASTAKPPTDAELATFRSKGFLAEMAASSVGHGLDDPARLPAAQHELWDRANTADAAGKRGQTLDALKLLEAAMRDLPEGPSRIDAIARHVRNEGFGTWMARVHLDVITDKYSNGQFDLTDVRDVERPALIGLLRGKMPAALEPLKSYFPPVDEKTGLAQPFKPAQLAGITLSNAIELKDQSQLAAALLLAQLKLEPQMSSLDRGFLSSQLSNVNHILSRTRELEPQARAAIIKAQQDQRLAAEKAHRDAAMAGRKTAAPR